MTLARGRLAIGLAGLVPLAFMRVRQPHARLTLTGEVDSFQIIRSLEMLCNHATRYRTNVAPANENDKGVKR